MSSEPQTPRCKRSNRRRWIGFGLIIGLISLIAVPIAMARRGPLNDEEAVERAEKMLERVLDKIDASEAQEAEVQAIFDKTLPQALELRKAARQLRGEAREAMMADEPDVEQLEALRQRGLKLADEGSKLALDAVLEVHKILTPEQRAEIKGFMSKFARHHHH